jgi:hypothetical protein
MTRIGLHGPSWQNGTDKNNNNCTGHTNYYFGVTSILRNGNYASILIKHANTSWGVISKVPPAYS